MGRNSFERQTNYTMGVIESNGDFVGHGGNNTTVKWDLVMVNQVIQDKVEVVMRGFTFTDWMTSTDNKNLTNTEFTGRMVTPDGEGT